MCVSDAMSTELNALETARVLGYNYNTAPSFDFIKPLEKPDEAFSWGKYTESQMREKLLFQDILGELCGYVPKIEEHRVGRPSLNPQEVVFCMTSKLYERLSSRRLHSDLELAKHNGHIAKVPFFTTLMRYFNNAELSPVLLDLIRLSALPLRDFETTFAVDASGLSSSFYSRWFDYRFDRNPEAKMHKWIKIHIICGTKTNIVTDINVTEGTVSDSPQFPALVNNTAKNFRIKEVYADKGYSGRENNSAAFDVGAVPFILFKSNTTGKSGGSYAWKRMFHYYQLHREEFLAHYHQRSNVESTFSMLKRKFSTKLMTKNEVAQVNEALAMVLCHNICVLVREITENGIAMNFKDNVLLFNQLNKNRGIKWDTMK